MAAYIIQRVLLTGLVVLGALAIVFFLTHIIPADPARAALGENATQAQVDQYRHELGLDLPITVQFGRYIGRLAHGDLGRSIVSTNKVSDDLANTVPASIELLVPSVVLSIAWGVCAGVVSAVRRGSLSDHTARIVSILGMSLPIFWFGLILQLVFYSRLSWLPAGGRLPLTVSPPPRLTGLYSVDAAASGEWDVFFQALRYMVLPVITLSLINIATIARFARASLLDVMHQEYVVTARAKGLRERTVIYRHALKNALIPLVTVIGLRIGVMFGGAVVTETIFAWPGVGRYAVLGLQRVDLPVVSAFTIYVTAVFAVLNAVVDISYAFLDPRIRTR